MQLEGDRASWRGGWVGAPQSVDGSRLHRVAFRTRVDLATTPTSLPIRISADSRYVLWVNGREIGRGPVRGQPYRWTFDSYDIAPDLTVGVNVVAVLVTFYGSENAIWQRSRAVDGLGTRAALVVDAPSDQPGLSTGGDWLAQPLDAWSTTPARGLLGALPIEILDQRLLNDAWKTAPAASAGFAPVGSAHATHPGSSRRSRPPVYPYGALRPRGMAPLEGAVVSPDVARVTRPGPVDEHTPVDTVHRALSAAAQWRDEQGPEQSTGPADPILWTFDFGRVLSGFVEFDFEAPEGTVLDLAYLERSFDPSKTRYLPVAGARVIASGGRGRFRALETNGLRIVAVLATPPLRGAVTIQQLRVHEHLYPISGGASYSSSDADLERLWRAGRRTVHLNSVDAFTDCPTREQRAWVGDAVVHTAVQLVANEDWRLIERHLEMSDSPRPDGMLPMSVAGDIESAGRYSIPDWSLHWLHAVWLYARTSKRAEFIRARLPTAERMLTWFEQYMTPDGVLTDVPEWAIIDWSSVFTTGKSAILTALWTRGLAEFAELSEWVGNHGNARRASNLVARITPAFECFWDSDRQLYVDHIVDGCQQPAVSQAANAAAIVAGVVPPDRLEPIVLRLTDEDALVTRGWNSASPTVPLDRKIQDRADGVQRVDWDVNRQIVRAEPFFSSVVHEAVAKAGRADLIPGLLRRWLTFLEDGYDTFGECWEWGTPAHGWSSTPTSDLVRHVLGIRPQDLPRDAYLIEPVPGQADWTTADVPTHRGLLSVEVRGSHLRVDAPLPVVIKTWDGQSVERAAGTHRIDLATGALVTSVPEPRATTGRTEGRT
ncbi:hypothetical protein HF576_15205 [Microbacterium sp. CFH 90308]|uniref:Alpha-L-rhamnosidase six-hairpin glycosidase domain-containing protein n=1 Tax=Microbacterium salsuginis TaxID=2722803 RepID=A0ABX1KGF4_9MICO|nr:hypothetical protein [Microbacterium sp. CFH 90308]NLP85194.1 hypothetical protein [Microbacterium sp. CFH 90308]